MAPVFFYFFLFIMSRFSPHMGRKGLESPLMSAPYIIWGHYIGCEDRRLTMASDEIQMFGDGGMVLTGRGIDVFRAYAVAKSLILYKTTGMKMTRTATPKAMMTIATQITGKKFSARDYLGAAQALMDWADEVSQSIQNKE